MTKFEALFVEKYENLEYSARKKTIIGNYVLGRCLGEGTFAKVKMAVHMPTGERVRMTILNICCTTTRAHGKMPF